MSFAANGWDFSFEARDAMPALYGQLRQLTGALAIKGKKLTLRCSTRTYNEHLDTPYMAAGPWVWDIDDSLEFGKVLCHAALAHEHNEAGELVASFSITDGVILN